MFNYNDAICGGTREVHLDGYKDEIKSDNIVEFTYNNDGEYRLWCKLENNILHVTSNGGNSYHRDGTYFGLKYDTDKLDILKKLNDIIKENNISKNNGFVHETAGLPPGIGDSIEVVYDSGEKIYKISNQFPVVGDELGKKFYDVFHELALEYGYDFNTEKSNVLLYDDATEEYLQGRWKGDHFGHKYEVLFEGNHVKVWEDDKLVDDTDYVIYEGRIRPNKLAEGVTEPKSFNDYEPFNAFDSLRKQNKILLTMYFYKNGSSSNDELLRQKED